MSAAVDLAGVIDRSAAASTRRQLRGSSLLLGGRVLSLALNFVSQVLVVRALSTRDYGAFAYAIAAVGFFDGVSSLGLRSCISRFAPIYHERRDWDRLFGSIAVVLITIVAISSVVIAAVFVAPQTISRLVHGDDEARLLLGILIFMVPLEAFDDILVALFASFTKPRAIFFRKHVLAPGLKLATVALLVAFHAPVAFLAWGTLLTSAAGIVLYGVLLVRLFEEQGLLAHMQLRRLRLPWRELFSFAIPLLTSDLVNVVMASASTFFLGYYHGTHDVAFYRVVFPAVRLNLLVMTSFQMLYMPQAARLFARGDHEGVNTFYWRTAVWMAVLSFPIFAVTFSLAHPLTVALYGEKYESSWRFLQLLSLSYYCNVATGFNGLTLRVLGKLRSVVALNIAAVGLSVLLDVLLIPRWGGAGAAVATAVAMIVYNLLKQIALRYSAHLRFFEWQYASFYLLLIGGAAGLAALQWAGVRSLYWTMPAAAAVSVFVVLAAKDKLRIEENFPELLRLPGLGRLLRLRLPVRGGR